MLGRAWTAATFAFLATVAAYWLTIVDTGNRWPSAVADKRPTALQDTQVVGAALATTTNIYNHTAEDASYFKWRAAGQILEKRGRLAEAVRLYSLALSYRQDQLLQEHLALLRDQVRQSQSVRTMASEILAQAEACAKEGRYQDAWQLYQRLGTDNVTPQMQTKMDLCRQNMETMRALTDMLHQADTLVQNGDWTAAIPWLEKAGRLYKEWFSSHNNTALLHNDIGQAEDNLVFLRRHDTLISLLVQQGRIARALQYIADLPSQLPKQGLQVKLAHLLQQEMVLVAAGPFIMGSTVETDEAPPQPVTLPAYYIDRYEVSNRQYDLFVSTTGVRPPVSRQERSALHDWHLHPVNGVSWEEAEQYAEWAGKRLPTEAEWEKAARGNDGRIYPWGNTFASERCNALESGWQRSTPVGSFLQEISPVGCFDMAGNVLEWTSDVYAPYTGGSVPTTIRHGYRVARGGAWYYPGQSLRCSNRYPQLQTARLAGIGFRCALDYRELAENAK
jgi:formylglycine-generating enzyme required for sulfatase activity